MVFVLARYYLRGALTTHHPIDLTIRPRSLLYSAVWFGGVIGRGVNWRQMNFLQETAEIIRL
jgi:hypothetical protein